MNTNEMTIDQLKTRKAEIEKQIHDLKRAQGEVDEQLFHLRESPAYASMVGSCFFYNNSIRGYPEDREWKEYSRIISYNPDDATFKVLRCYSNSEKTSLNIITEPASYYDKDSCMLFKPLSEEEFWYQYRCVKSCVGGWD